MARKKRRNKRKPIRIVERKLGREQAWGQQEPGFIELDPRMKSKKYLEILIHELAHDFWPNMSETQVTNGAKHICRGVWQQNYRKIAP